MFARIWTSPAKEISNEHALIRNFAKNMAAFGMKVVQEIFIRIY